MDPEFAADSTNMLMAIAFCIEHPEFDSMILDKVLSIVREKDEQTYISFMKSITKSVENTNGIGSDSESSAESSSEEEPEVIQCHHIAFPRNGRTDLELRGTAVVGSGLWRSQYYVVGDFVVHPRDFANVEIIFKREIEGRGKGKEYLKAHKKVMALSEDCGFSKPLEVLSLMVDMIGMPALRHLIDELFKHGPFKV